MRRMQGGGGGMKSIFNFGKSKAKIWTSDMPKVTFDDGRKALVIANSATESLKYNKLVRIKF